MTTFSVIGAGNLGSNLIFALRGSQYSFKYIYNRSKYLLFSSHIETSLEKVISGSDVIFISVQESGISEAVNEIGSMKNLSGKIFFHTSNSLTSDELIPLRDKGGIVASFSPLQTFPEFTKDLNIFSGVYFLSEGDPEAVKLADQISEYLKARNLEVDKESKIFFHIGAVISSNFFNSLLRFADLQVKKGGDFNYEILLPLVKQTLKNIEKEGLDKSLTGPASRKESGIISKHMDSLSGSEKELYRLLNKSISKDRKDLS